MDPRKHEVRSRIGVTINYHQGRYGIEIRNGSQSWVMVGQIRDGNATRKTRKPRRLAAEARPKQTSLPMSSSLKAKMPFNMQYDQLSFDVVQKMNRLLRHEPLPREEDGAVEFKILAPVSHNSSLLRMAESFAKKRSQKEIPVLPGSELSRYFPLPSSNSRPFWRKSNLSNIARQRDVTQ